MREILPMVQEEREKFREHEHSLLTTIIEDGIQRNEFRNCDAKLLATTILASLEGMTDAFVVWSKDDQIMAGLDHLLDLFLNGLNAR